MLAYTVEHQVQTFVEPVLELCGALLRAYTPAPNGRPNPFGDMAPQGGSSADPVHIGRKWKLSSELFQGAAAAYRPLAGGRLCPCRSLSCG